MFKNRTRLITVTDAGLLDVKCENIVNLPALACFQQHLNQSYELETKKLFYVVLSKFFRHLVFWGYVRH